MTFAGKVVLITGGAGAIAQVIAEAFAKQGAEVAATVLWLASDDASFVVGHDLVVDGGATA